MRSFPSRGAKAEERLDDKTAAAKVDGKPSEKSHGKHPEIKPEKKPVLEDKPRKSKASMRKNRLQDRRKPKSRLNNCRGGRVRELTRTTVSAKKKSTTKQLSKKKPR